jgi:prepilin peptidase CpaA
MLAALVIVSGTAIRLDLRDRRLPNWLTVGGLAAALLLRAISPELVVWPGIVSAACALAFGFPFFAVGGLGAGDVKLMAALAAFLDPSRLIAALMGMAAAGAAMAVVSSARRGLLPLTLVRVAALVQEGIPASQSDWVDRRRANLRRHSASDSVTSPYGIAVVCGALIGWFV